MVPQDPKIITQLIWQGPLDMPSQEENKEQHIEALAEKGIHTLARMGRALCAQLTAPIVDLPEFPRMKKMLDLGGGPCLNCMAIVRAHPSLTGTVFDFQERCLIFLR